ncbi:MAG TPA: VTT domain-containing protein [Bacteroidia bacterium]|jgi:membrane-associated protein|nr:VTT domain-containing protein [Bacteroidia bacterium]HRG51816.1 VTT domain-containing protein [Bacteroidia bacterium]
MEFWEFFKKLLDPESIIEYGGLALLLIVMFAETGLLVGFFLPGDSLVFIAGMICVSKPMVLDVNIYTLLSLMSLAAILGNIAGYWFGHKVGPPLFERKDSLLFKKQYLIVTQKFYDKNGGRTLIIGRFLPIIRTFAPILAGVFKMNFKKFLLYNIIGAVAWIGLLGGAGYYLGTNKWIQKNIGLIVIFLVIITLIPVFNSFRKKKPS